MLFLGYTFDEAVMAKPIKALPVLIFSSLAALFQIQLWDGLHFYFVPAPPNIYI